MQMGTSMCRAPYRSGKQSSLATPIIFDDSGEAQTPGGAVCMHDDATWTAADHQAYGFLRVE